MRKLTINDIADLAGVSRQTVSRVLNDKGDVREETRQRVIRIMEENGYQPSLQARSMITQKTNTVALLIPSIINPFFPEIVAGIEETLRSKKLNVFLFMTNEDINREISSIKLAQQYNVDGIILCSPRLDDANLKKLLPGMPPTVLLNRQVEIEDIYSVVIDGFGGGYEAAKYLINSGHEKIGIIVGPFRSKIGLKRLEGYKSALKEFGLIIDEKLIIVERSERLDFYSVLKDLLNNKVTAILAYNDVIAAQLLQASYDLGLTVPNDLSIVGFDGISISKQVIPRLTTMEVPLYEVGVILANMISKLLNGEKPVNNHLEISPILRISQSTNNIVKSKEGS